MMRERYTYTVAVDLDHSGASEVDRLMEQIAAITGSVRTDFSFVCSDCGCDWSENRCRPCEALSRREGHE